MACAHDVDDRNAAEALRARIFIARSSFPTRPEDEYYWVDLIGLEGRQPRRGSPMGTVRDLLSTGRKRCWCWTSNGMARCRSA